MGVGFVEDCDIEQWFYAKWGYVWGEGTLLFGCGVRSLIFIIMYCDGEKRLNVSLVTLNNKK